MEAALIASPILPLPSDLFDFSKARPRIDKIIGDWQTDTLEADLRRKERYIDVDVEALRQSEEIAEDETLIPDRVIDTNIGRDKADAMNFLNAGFRLAVFDCVSEPTIDCRELEIQFTKGLTYDGWYSEFESCEDGAELHKMAYVEVVLDTSKPLYVGFEYIPFDKLFYNRRVRNLQQSEFLAREYDINLFVLEGWSKKYAFDSIQIDSIRASKEGKHRDQNVKVYRVYFKDNNQVFVAWYTKDTAASGWLKNPEPLRIGIHDLGTLEELPLDMYPIFTRLYKPDENEILVEHYGRGFLDGPQQEFNTAVLSAYANNLLRSSDVYASPINGDAEGSLKQLDIKMVPGTVYSNPLNFWSLPAPAVETLQAVTFFDSRNAAAQGKTAFTVINRKDSRKTKKELDLAEQQEGKITSTTLANFSNFLRSIFNFAWRIVQSQAMLDRIPLLQIELEKFPGHPELGLDKINDKFRIAQRYDIRPAGDTDIIQAEIETQKMRMDWPVVQVTALKDVFLEDYIKLMYPKRAKEYIAILKRGNVAKQLVASLGAVLQSALSPEEIAQLPPERAAELQNLAAQTQQFLATP